MDEKVKKPTIVVRRAAKDQLLVAFPESIEADLDAVLKGDRADIPVELLIAALSRSAAAAKIDALANCERCSKDCFW